MHILEECIPLVCLVNCFAEVRKMKHLPMTVFIFHQTRIMNTSFSNGILFDEVCRDATRTCYGSIAKHSSGTESWTYPKPKHVI